MDMIRPPALRPGDILGVFAPAAPVKPAQFERGLALLAPHFNLRLAPGVEARHDHLAGTDAARAEQLNTLLADPDVRGVIAARGGFGSTRMLSQIDPSLLRDDPRPLVGFSDVTALLAFAAIHGVGGIHGPVVSRLGGLPPDDLASLVRALTDPRPLGLLPWRLTPLGGPAARFTAPLVPANLTMLAHLVGTPWQLDGAGCALLIEEVTEPPYAIDRDLTQLGLAGVLDRCAGVVVGDLTRCTDPPVGPSDPDDPGPARAAVAEHLLRRGIPGLLGAPVGHGARNVSLPFGCRATVDVAAGTIELLEAAVS